MRKIKLFLIVYLVFYVSNLQAIDGILLVTTDYTFQDKWHKTVSSTIPQFMTVKEVFKEQEFYIALIAGDFGLNEEKASVVYDIEITNPKRKEYLKKENLPLIDKKVNPKYLQMSDAILRIVLTEKDLLGKYMLKIKVKDLVSGKSKIIKSEFVLKKLPAYNAVKIENDHDVGQWLKMYYKEQKPEIALAHYIYYAKSEMADNEDSFLPVFSVILEIVNHNPFLLEQILDAFEKEASQTRFYLIYLLHYSNLEANDFLSTLEGIEKEAYIELQKSSLPDPYDLIFNPAQLDMLWAEFMASGSYKSILRLIHTLDYVKYEGGIEAYATSDQTEEDKTNLLNDAIYDALVWSLKANCEQHPLVKKYALWALENETLSDVQKEELSKILTK